VYTGLWDDYTPPRPFGDLALTEISVVNQDTILAALELQDEKLNPLVLNMASDRTPGGGVKNGARAQEEDLFRRTNYCMHLNNKTVTYPLGPSQVVYTPNVAVFKDEKYNLVNHATYLTFVACPGIRNRSGGRLSARDLSTLKTKIRMIFQTAAHHCHHSLVLGALGCGAFKCRPEDVIPVFNEVIKEYLPGTFKKIVFAVLSRNDRNFTVFNEQIQKDLA
jgi:uncharacterized protein (TIGR02452 family)